MILYDSKQATCRVSTTTVTIVGAGTMIKQETQEFVLIRICCKRLLEMDWSATLMRTPHVPATKWCAYFVCIFSSILVKIYLKQNQC